MKEFDDEAKTFEYAVEHFENHAFCINAMKQVLVHFMLNNNELGWKFYRIDNGRGFWLTSPTGKSFAIHYKYGKYGDLAQGIEVNNYNFCPCMDEKYTNFEISPDMADKIVNHLMEFEKKPLN